MITENLEGWYIDLNIKAKEVKASLKLIRVNTDYGKNLNKLAEEVGTQKIFKFENQLEITEDFQFKIRTHEDLIKMYPPQKPFVLRLGNKYRPKEKEMTSENIVLFGGSNFGKSYQEAVSWALQNGLQKTTPHSILEIGRQFENLGYELSDADYFRNSSNIEFPFAHDDHDGIYIVETTGCFLRKDDSRCFCCVEYYGEKKKRATIINQNDCNDYNGIIQIIYENPRVFYAFKKIIPPSRPEGTLAGSYYGC